MLHIKDIEAFASINEALARNARSPSPGPSSLPRRAPQVVPFPAREREGARETVNDGADTLGGAGYDFDLVPKRPSSVTALFGRMFFGRR